MKNESNFGGGMTKKEDGMGKIDSFGQKSRLMQRIQEKITQKTSKAHRLKVMNLITIN